MLPTNITDRVIRQYISKTRKPYTGLLGSSSSTHFYKLPYVGYFSKAAQYRIRQLCKHYRDNIFGVKDPVPIQRLQSLW